MLITANLPINRDKFAQKDQVLTITGATWSDYHKFDSDDYPGYHASYFEGEIIIVSPGINHERIAGIIDKLITGYCEKYDKPYFIFGETRLNAPNQAGREPDLAYSFDYDKDLPDLAVEVIFSSGDIEILLSSYLHLKIPELWVWKNNKITFYYLEQDNYITIKSSKMLEGIESESFIKYVNQGIKISPMVIKKDFLKLI